MADPALPASLMEEVRELRRRVERLEMSSRLTSASFTDGAFRVLDATGQERVVLGRHSDGTYGIHVFSENGKSVFIATEEGLVSPSTPVPIYQGASLTPVAGLAFTTSATMVELMRADFVATAPTVNVDFFTRVDAGTTGEFEVTVQGLGGTAQTVLGPWTDAVDMQRGGTFTIPDSALAAPDPVGRYIILRVNGRRTAGAGKVYANAVTGVRCPA